MKNIIIKNSDRFKSVFVTVNLLLPLEADKTGKNALLAMVLKKSNELYKTEKQLERVLASLYDTTIDVNIEKLDNLYNIQVGMELLNGNYMSKEDIEKAKQILCAIICKPNFVNRKFDEEIFLREKTSLLQKIAEERDDKKKYALECLKQDMFKGTDYGAHSLGTTEMVEKISNEDLSKHYEYVVNNAEIIVSAVGNLSGMETFAEDIYNIICEKCGKHTVENIQDVEKKHRGIEERVENQEINQSVLCIGLRAENVTKDDGYALMLYNAILGGTPASKLFQNVREKESLAYFAKSVYNKLKQAIYMYSGIDPVNDKKAKTVMLQQLDLIKNGKVSEEEFNAAKHSLVSAYKELSDSKVAISRNMLNNEIYFGYDVDLDEMVNKLQELTLNDVITVANKIVATNVFLLGGVAHV